MVVRPCSAAIAVVIVAFGSGGAMAQEPQARTLLAAWQGNSGWAMDDVRAMERWQGRRFAVLNVFTSWCERDAENLFARQLPAVWDAGHVPLLTWEPFLCGATPSDIARRVAAGELDGYVDGWAARLRAFLSGPDGVLGTADDRRAYLRPAHEMNGDWYPWAGSPGDWRAMWRRVVGKFRAQGLGARHVQWMFCANNVDAGSRMEDYFPGDEWIDWVAVDGYNWGASREWSRWAEPAEVFDPMIARLRALSRRPLAITEVGCGSAGAPRAGKGAWIDALGDYVRARDVRMLAWFNEDKEADWAVYGGAGGDCRAEDGRRGWDAFRRLASGTGFAGAPLDDDAFAGR